MKHDRYSACEILFYSVLFRDFRLYIFQLFPPRAYGKVVYTVNIIVEKAGPDGGPTEGDLPGQVWGAWKIRRCICDTYVTVCGEMNLACMGTSKAVWEIAAASAYSYIYCSVLLMCDVNLTCSQPQRDRRSQVVMLLLFLPAACDEHHSMMCPSARRQRRCRD